MSSREQAGTRALGFWDRLIEPVAVLDTVDHRKARLLAALLLSIVVLGTTSAVVQAASIPNFGPTLVSMGAALVVLTLAYAGSRTRRYRVSAALAAAAPALACIATGVQSPDDRVWYAFMLIAVVVASLFFSLRTAALVAAAIFTALCLLPIWILELRSPARLLPVLALHGVLSPLLLIAARHHAAVERDGREELARREARLAELERRDAQARSAAHIAHDLNNLITVVDANLGFLEQRYVQGQSELVRETRTAIARICTLTRDLAGSGSQSVERATTFDPLELIRDIRPLLAQIAGQRVEVVVGGDAGDAQVTMDPLRLEQVLMNLIANARDAMPNGGRVSVECSTLARGALPAGHGENGAPRAGDYAVIDVEDTGMGMSPAMAERVFEPFFTTKADGHGHGLGLVIVREVMKQCGGSVSVASEPGRGARFRLLLPATSAPSG